MLPTKTFLYYTWHHVMHFSNCFSEYFQVIQVHFFRHFYTHTHSHKSIVKCISVRNVRLSVWQLALQRSYIFFEGFKINIEYIVYNTSNLKWCMDVYASFSINSRIYSTLCLGTHDIFSIHDEQWWNLFKIIIKPLCLVH